uniref:Uncharacterized protein n=1 Tax=Daucus carota subsp. sativus TaxID=79200 RepID=A0A166EA72_DAUCS
MVNFHNLVENTSKLRFSSDIAVIERGLEALAKFKSHGFDVENVQACLTQLLLKKQKAEELQKECDDTRSKISNSSHKGELDEEISRLCQKLKEIEKELSQAKLKKENRDTDSSALQSRMHAVAENIKSIQVEFESIVGSLGWESEDDGGDQKVHCKYGIDFVEFQERAEVMLRLLHKRLPRLMGHYAFS